MHKGKKVGKDRGKPGKVVGAGGRSHKVSIGPIKQNMKARHRKGLPNTKVISAMR